MTRPDEVVMVQPAVNLETCAAEIDGILAEIRKGEAVLDAATRFVDDWRTKAGAVFLQVRKTIPERGPNAKKWGDFVAERGISLNTASRYMQLAEHAAANPGAPAVPVIDIYRELGIKAPAAAPAPPAAPVAIKSWDTQYTIGTPAPRVFPALPPVQPGILSWAELPEWADPAVYTRAPAPPPDAASYFPRVLRQELSREQMDWRFTFMKRDDMDAELERVRPFREAHRAARQARKEAAAAAAAPPAAAAAQARAKPEPEPLPQAQDPVAAAVQVIEAAEAMGKADATRKAPRLIGEVVSKLRQQGHLIPAGEDRTVYGAYERGRSWRAPALPLGPVAQPKPSLYTTPLFPDGPGPALAQPRSAAPAAPAAREEDEDDFDADDDRHMAGADEDEADEDELREAVDEVEGELARAKKEMEGLRADLVQARRERDGAREEIALLCRERDQAQRDSELVAKAHAQALKTMEGMERELTELRTKLAGAKFTGQVRDALADQVRRLREEADACGLTPCEGEADDGDFCGRLALPCSDGPALCRRHQQPVQAARVEGTAPTWQPASIGGAKAVHALPAGGSEAEGGHHPAALCSQRPSYKSKGWTPRPGVALTCDACRAEAGLT